MDRRVVIFAIVAGILLGGVGSLFLLGVLKPKTAGILIEANTEAQVFIDGRKLGKTPFDSALLPHEAVVRLLPDDNSLLPYETKVLLNAGIKTIVRRNFGQTEAGSSGQIISFQKTDGEKSVVWIVTDPDRAQVTLDGKPVGFAPLKISKVTVGNHRITVDQPGTKPSVFDIRTANGYDLTAIVKLEADKKDQIWVEVLKTPAGFLAAREAPNTVSGEVGRAVDGQKYALISKSGDLGWYQIDLGGGRTGWVETNYTRISP